MRLIAVVTDPLAVSTILRHPGEPTTSRRGPRPWPPLWDQAPEPVANWVEAPAPVPEFVFDQRLSW